MLCHFVEAKTREDARRTRRGHMRRNIDETGLNFTNAGWIGRCLGLGQQLRAFKIGGKHEIDQALRAARRLLLDTAKAGCAW